MPIPPEILTWLEQSQITPVECCGKGGYGEIWLVQAPFGQKWALKIIDKTKLESAAWEREVRAIQKYRAVIGLDLNLLYIQQAGDLKDYFFYLMEIADNRNSNANGPYMPDTLANRLHEQRLTFLDTEKYINGLLDGLQTLHKRGLIHRDIKPDNIFFVNGRPKFGDLGLVTDYTPTLSFAGTEGFCPPSLLDGEQVDGMLWDLYSMGMVVYCCVTGYTSPCYPEIPEDLLENPTMQRINHFLERACSPVPRECFKNVTEFREAFNACFQKSKPHGKPLTASLLAGIAIGIACSTGLVLISHLKTNTTTHPTLTSQQETVKTELPSISPIQAFKRGSIAKFYDAFQYNSKPDWLIHVSNSQPLQKVGIAGLFWTSEETTPPGNQLSLSLPNLTLPVNFEIAWECFGDFDECSLYVVLSKDENTESFTPDIMPKVGLLFELLENHGNISLKRIVRNGKETLSSNEVTIGSEEDNVFITTNRIVKDGYTLTYYLDEQAMFTMKLTEQELEYLKNARFSMIYRTAYGGIAVIKNFTVFYVPGLE